MEAFFRRIRPNRPRPSQQFQILSDLHLEVGQQYATFTFPVSAPCLVLAGDIGRLVDYDGYRTFLAAQVTRYQNVFLVLGNHEFYGLDYASGLTTAQRLVNEPALANRVDFLHRQRWDDPDGRLTILGCTLWSRIPAGAYDVVASKVSDYRKINGWTVQSHNDAHAADVAWLRHQVAALALQNAEAKRPLLVVTHHAPCLEGTSRPEHTNNPWSPAFATDLLGNNAWTGVTVWVFGHTHYSTDFSRNGIRVVANQRGYVLPGSAALEKPSAASKDKKNKKNNLHEFDAAMTIAI
ncbi:Ser/Thr protein phosphatase [Niveomyces insectorum RCEF 264]|uniref:Ser/Thr protein phosphatase n=1 Tax=Niveomyces insectorum RCEF 264 TaxID=1081102 RepID=A0A167U5D1_9HYPO|nr:Ser/Thr protein phosphatase [Niveomyces insectorum RCEF 264]